MLRSYTPTQRRGILPLLFPVLLLLPALHLHPAYEHAHGTHEAHQHASVVHADFFPISAHNHGEHHKGHGVPDDTSSQLLSQIKFPTLLPRSLALSPPALQRVPISLPVAVLVIALPFLLQTRLLTRDHAPPVQDCVFSPAPPRSPPHVV